MRRMIALLTVVLTLQLALAAALAMRKNPLASTTPASPLIAAPLDQVDHIVIEGPRATGASAVAARVELAKHNGQWVLPRYFNAPVDKFKVSSILSELTSLKRGLPIATSSSALKRFELVDEDFERRLVLSQGARPVSTLYLGSSAGARKSAARTAGDHAVYNVDLGTYEVPAIPTDWFDTGVLQREPASLTELDITGATAQPPLQLLRPASPSSTAALGAAAWLDPSLPSGRHIDSARADSLARDVAQLHVQAVLGVAAASEWQQDHPLLTLRIRDDKHPGQLVTWTLSKPKPSPTPAARPPHGAPQGPQSSAPAASAEDYYVLKDSARPWYFRLSAATGKQLLDDSSPQMLLAVASQSGR